MKIAYSWLKEHIDIELPPEELADILTRTGLEVDSHEPLKELPEGLEDLVVGKVEAVHEHPNADKLVLTQVDVGGEEMLSIVCGAPNVEAGQKVIVATPGTTVHPTGSDPIKVKKAKIRGQKSYGMICSAMEIGMGEDHDGIFVLDSDAEVGRPVSELFQGKEDHLFEIDITPNRADAISVMGVARDIDAYLKVHEGRELRKPLEDPELPEGNEKELPIEVKLEDPEACPRYCGISIKGVKVGPSPEWLQDKLERVGATPINNVVDATNYVLFDIGQPLHAFDASAVRGDQVIVGKLASGTGFTTLDGEERKLDGTELMICNGEREPMCMAGVLGGSDSGVDENTSDIFLESAYFDPASIRRSSSAHGISTDASFLFERGADPEMPLVALRRAVKLILELAGGAIASLVQDERGKDIEWKRISLDYERIARQIGEPIETERILTILRALEMEIEEEGEGGCRVKVPPYRVDVTREADLLEEILRIHGYDRIGMPDRLRSSISHTPAKDREAPRRALTELLTSGGFHEITTNSLVHSEKGEELVDREKEIPLLNPISSELDVLRQRMAQSGLSVIAHNLRRKEMELRFFEFGKVYWKEGERFDEEERLVLYMTGSRDPENWRNRNEALSFFDLKGEVRRILKRVGVLNELRVEELSSPHLQEGMAFSAEGLGPIVEFGELDPSISKIWDIERPLFVAEFRAEKLFESWWQCSVRYRPLSKQLPVRKDMAFILDREHRFEELRKLAFEAEDSLLKEVDLFDVYEGDRIQKGKKSYAMKFIFHDAERTLKDEELDQAMERIRKRFEEAFGAELRDH